MNSPEEYLKKERGIIIDDDNRFDDSELSWDMVIHHMRQYDSFLSSESQVKNHEAQQPEREVPDALYKALKSLYHTINGNSNPPKYAQLAIADAKKALKLVDGITR